MCDATASESTALISCRYVVTSAPYITNEKDQQAVLNSHPNMPWLVADSNNISTHRVITPIPRNEVGDPTDDGSFFLVIHI